MAIQTEVYGNTTDAAGEVATLSYVYNDNTGKLTQIIMDNPNTRSVRVTVKSPTDAWTPITRDFAPNSPIGTPTTLNVPGNVPVTVRPSGRLDGVELVDFFFI